MPRFALLIEYDGSPFHGWQAQAGLPSVQAVIEGALAKLDPGFANGSERLAAAGRTDAGVHALAQTAHADLSRDWDSFRLTEALNAHLRPHPVAILASARVDEGFHARFSAIGRHYVFHILNRRAPPALDAGRVWHIRHPLDPELMREGAQHLLGRHDFTTFRSTLCQAKSPIRSIDAITITSAPCTGGQMIRLEFRARSFLHNQVRSITGTLERVGAGRWPPSRVAEALAARDRASCGPVSPPDGLFLSGVDYPANPFTDQRRR